MSDLEETDYLTPWRIAVIAFLVIVIGLIGAYLAVRQFAFRGTRDRAREALCKHNLKGIGLAMDMYRNDFGGYWPYSEDGALASVSLIFDQYMTTHRNFACFSTRDDASTITAGGVLKRHQFSYEYLPGKLGVPLGSDAPKDLVVAYDRKPIHYRGSVFQKAQGRNVLLSSAYVEFMLEPKFRQRLGKDRERYQQLQRKGQNP